MKPKTHTDQHMTSDDELGGFGLLLVPLAPAFRAIGVKRTKGYELIATGQLTMVKIGSKSLVTVDSLRGFAASLTPIRRGVAP